MPQVRIKSGYQSIQLSTTLAYRNEVTALNFNIHLFNSIHEDPLIDFDYYARSLFLMSISS